MMETAVEKRKEQLRLEIEAAKSQLNHNLDNLKPLNYLKPDISNVSGNIQKSLTSAKMVIYSFAQKVIDALPAPNSDDDFRSY